MILSYQQATTTPELILFSKALTELHFRDRLVAIKVLGQMNCRLKLSMKANDLSMKTNIATATLHRSLRRLCESEVFESQYTYQNRKVRTLILNADCLSLDLPEATQLKVSKLQRFFELLNLADSSSPQKIAYDEKNTVLSDAKTAAVLACLYACGDDFGFCRGVSTGKVCDLTGIPSDSVRKILKRLSQNQLISKLSGKKDFGIMGRNSSSFILHDLQNFRWNQRAQQRTLSLRYIDRHTHPIRIANLLGYSSREVAAHLSPERGAKLLARSKRKKIEAFVSYAIEIALSVSFLNSTVKVHWNAIPETLNEFYLSWSKTIPLILDEITKKEEARANLDSTLKIKPSRSLDQQIAQAYRVIENSSWGSQLLDLSASERSYLKSLAITTTQIILEPEWRESMTYLSTIKSLTEVRLAEFPQPGLQVDLLGISGDL